MRAWPCLAALLAACAGAANAPDGRPTSQPQRDELPEFPLGFDPDGAPASPGASACERAAQLAAGGDVDRAREALWRGTAADWASVAALWREGAPCMAWLGDAGQEGRFQVELRRLEPKLRRAYVFGMPLVRKRDGSMRAGVYLFDEGRFVPAHPHVPDSVAAYFAQDSRRALVVTGRLAGDGAAIEDFGFRVYETQRPAAVAAHAGVPWRGRLRVALEPDSALFVASADDYPWYEIAHGWVSEGAYRQFLERFVIEPGGGYRPADPEREQIAGARPIPQGPFVEFTRAGLMLRRESTTFFLIEGPALDLAGTLVPLGEPLDEEYEWVAARRGRTHAALSLLFPRCGGSAMWHRVVEIEQTARDAATARVLADGPGLGLGLYDLDGRLFVQGGERLTVYTPDGEARALPEGLMLLSTLPPVPCTGPAGAAPGPAEPALSGNSPL